MPFTLFTSTQLPTMPWKNGGGVTREIACLPPGSGVQDFHWRLSIAEIAASGPFSAFAGVDRVITLLEGEGVHLHAADGSVNHRLNLPLQPFAFSGDQALGCELLGDGPCQDFNVMVRRSFGSTQVSLQAQRWNLPATGALLVRRGLWRVQQRDGEAFTLDAAAQDGAYWDALNTGAVTTPLTTDALLLAVQITTNATA
jgi:environmental stress-induced protein Ves